MSDELQKDPVTRGQFLIMGSLGTVVGAFLTIPPVIYTINPVIRSLQGQNDISNDLVPVGNVSEIPAGSVKTYRAKFPQSQTYEQNGSLVVVVLVSWNKGKIPGVVKNSGKQAKFSKPEIKEISQKLNVFSNACAHLGCPVRWLPDRGQILCPCHGGIYSIDGSYVGGPPPRGLYHFEFEVRENGDIYARHRFKDGKPYVY